MHLRLLSLLSLLGTACASQSPPSPRPASPPDAEYGTPHPFVTQVVSPNGRWFMACQARADTNHDGHISVQFDARGGNEGDTLRPYLFLEPGPGIAIDELLDWDRSGRHVVFVREGTLRLLDSSSGQEQVLSPGPFVTNLSPRPLSRASFSRDGSRLLYLRPQDGKLVAVLRDMARGTERVVDTGEGQVGQVILDDAGRWAVVHVMTEDTDKDGQLSWPKPLTNLAPALCRGPATLRMHLGWKGDRPTRGIATWKQVLSLRARTSSKPWVIKCSAGCQPAPSSRRMPTASARNGFQRAAAGCCSVSMHHVDSSWSPVAPRGSKSIFRSSSMARPSTSPWVGRCTGHMMRCAASMARAPF